MKIGMLSTCLAILTIGIGLSQQGPGNINFTMKTPFVVGNTTMPPGSYQIRATDDQSTMECSAASGVPSVFFDVESTEPVNPYTKSEVTFVKYGDKLVLKNIQTEGSLQGFMVVTTSAEKKHKKAAGGKGTKVPVAATK
jgi:hypothetical protein